MILRLVLVYAAPVWCSAAPTNIKPLQIFQNKCLRLILDKGRYTKISDLHKKAKIEYIMEYVKVLATKFYNCKLGYSDLTKGLTTIRSYNLPFKLKYKLPYQSLEIFQK